MQTFGIEKYTMTYPILYNDYLQFGADHPKNKQINIATLAGGTAAFENGLNRFLNYTHFNNEIWYLGAEWDRKLFQSLLKKAPENMTPVFNEIHKAIDEYHNDYGFKFDSIFLDYCQSPEWDVVNSLVKLLRSSRLRKKALVYVTFYMSPRVGLAAEYASEIKKRMHTTDWKKAFVRYLRTRTPKDWELYLEWPYLSGARNLAPMLLLGFVRGVHLPTGRKLV